MIVKQLRYSQYDSTSQEWKLTNTTFGKINLIVGENASGKSKILNLISNLGGLLSGDKPVFISANYKVTFDSNGKRISYILRCERGNVVEERLKINSKNFLTRGTDGVGKIYYEQLKNEVEFQAPPSQVVTTTRRDSIQHPFLEDLYNWGKSVRHFRFGTPLGQEGLVVPLEVKEGEPQTPVNPKATHMVVSIFIDGKKKFSDKFKQSIIENMRTIGYQITDVGVGPPHGISFTGLPGVVGLYVREADLNDITSQNEMSQGMFRALSLTVQIAYSEFTQNQSCILIDDIGEGLDYNRSSSLVKLLITKAQNNATQLIMATNDRFIMNNVPLEYWCVIQRTGNVSRIFNYRNSPSLFDEFRLTGLNNFDFFSGRYYLKGSRRN